MTCFSAMWGMGIPKGRKGAEPRCTQYAPIFEKEWNRVPSSPCKLVRIGRYSDNRNLGLPGNHKL